MKGWSLKSWALLAVGVLVVDLAILYAFDVIPAGDGEVLDDGHVPDFVYSILFVLFWGSLIGLLGLGVVAGLRRRRMKSQ